MTVLSPTRQGRRLRQLRLLGEQSQDKVAAAMGYGEGGSSSLSLIERGQRKMKDEQRRLAVNFLAGKSELIEDAPVLYSYLVGDHNSLDACLRATPDLEMIEGGPNKKVKRQFKPAASDENSILYFRFAHSDLLERAS
jgi:transcriptional regulator with XRE-family HTH domain